MAHIGAILYFRLNQSFFVRLHNCRISENKNLGDIDSWVPTTALVVYSFVLKIKKNAKSYHFKNVI